MVLASFTYTVFRAVVNTKVKAKFTQEQATRPQRGRFTAQLFL
jgi:hypothetical protein